MHTAASILEMIAKNHIEFVDFRFTDLLSKWHHMSFHRDAVTESLLTDGVMFDGSSIAGWKTIDDSDMVMHPDLNTAVMDPFTAEPTLIINCDVFNPTTGTPYHRDPRSIARKAEAYLKASGIAEKAFFGPEPEFFIFDSVRFDVSPESSFYEIISDEFASQNAVDQDHGNLAHRPAHKGAYFPVMPVDQNNDIRAEMLSTLKTMGLTPEKHHHEVAAAQHELGFGFGTLVQTADAIQTYKYVIKNVARSYGKTVTFMPKPIAGDNGSGMHVHQSLWSGGKTLFSGDEYAGLSDEALYYIGGILKHGHALNAFTNPTTNSYKRLVPGYEAPVILAYSARNRSACIRIPHTPSAQARRIEVRFPDPAANPYLAFTAMMMAGLDGIRNKIHPGHAAEGNLYDPSVSKNFGQLCGSLKEALSALDQDRAFLKEGGVFDDDFINSYIALKMQEVDAVNMRPHPLEFDLYYNA